MNKRSFLHLLWILPAYLLFLTAYEFYTWAGLIDTEKNGAPIAAQVEELKLKNMQAQSNGYIILVFPTPEGTRIRQKLSLPIQLAAKLQEYQVLPIHYKADSWQPIAIVPTLEFHKNMVLINVGIAGISFLITFFIAFFTSKYALKPKMNDPIQDAINAKRLAKPTR